MTKGRVAIPISITWWLREQRVPPLRYPGFPVDLGGVGPLHPPFFTEGRTRCLVQCSVAGNPGTLRAGWQRGGGRSHSDSILGMMNSRSLHFTTPDFLLDLV